MLDLLVNQILTVEKTMPAINILKYDIESKVIEGKTYIYDFLRKKYLHLTPEELVRQKLIRFLIEERNYPKALCRIEGGLSIGEMKKRTDVLFYNTMGQPFLLIECKSFKVNLTQNTFDQLSSYNQKIRARYIGVSNGIEHHFCEVNYQTRELYYLQDIPAYQPI